MRRNLTTLNPNLLLTKTARIDLHYLPSLEYFCALHSFEDIQLERHEYYVKQSFRNRCYITTSQGIQLLIVPLRDKHGKIPVQEVKIDHQQKWQNNHWRTLESAYRNAPYFEFYSDEIKKILYKGHKYLFDLNCELLSFCLKSVGFKVNLSFTHSYEMPAPNFVSDFRSQISPKKPFANRSFYHPIPYQQVFGNEFVPNLSILDLLFCEGPHSIRIIQSSKLNKTF